MCPFAADLIDPSATAPNRAAYHNHQDAKNALPRPYLEAELRTDTSVK